MTEHTVTRVLHHSQAKGAPRLALLVLACHADWMGGVSMPLRQIADLCNLSKTAIANAIEALMDAGELDRLDNGGGRATPAQYRIVVGGGHKRPNPVDISKPPAPVWIDRKPQNEPVTPPKPAPVVKVAQPAPAVARAYQAAQDLPPVSIPADLPQNAVGRALVTAGVEIDPMAGLYWFRQEHKDDLAALARKVGSEQELWDRLAELAPVGPIRRLTQLEGRLKGGQRG